MEDIRNVNVRDAIDILKKGESKAIIVSKDCIKVVDLPDFGIAGIRMIAGKMDHVEYNFTKK